MKKTLLLLSLVLLSCGQIIAQSFAMVDTGRLSLFSNGWDTRGIEIESINTTGNGATAYGNYPSVEITPQGAILMSDKGWIGGEVIRQNGVDMVINYTGDTLRFHTGEQIGFSWNFHVDLVDHLTVATIEAVAEESFIGITDSVKTISFETTHLGVPAPTWIDSIQVRISKNHGMVEGFNFYEFPTLYSNPATKLKLSHHFKFLIDYNSPDTTYTLTGLIDNSGVHGEGLLSPLEIFDIPDTLRYTRLHHVNEYYNGGYGGDWKTFFDHLVINHDITPNTSNIDAHTCYYNDWEEYTGTGTTHDTSSGVIDTMAIISTYTDYWLEGRPYEYRNTATGYEIPLHLRTPTNRRMTYIVQELVNPGLDSLIQGNLEQRVGFMNQLGQVYDYDEHSSGSGGGGFNQDLDIWRLMYYRIGSEEWIGSHSSFQYQPYSFDHTCVNSFVPVGNEDSLHESDGVVVYPNPSNGLLSIELGEAQTIEVYDLQGRLANTFSLGAGKNTVSINTPGLYVLRGKNWQQRLVITN